MRDVFLCIALLTLSAACATPSHREVPTIYGVEFRLTLDAQGKVVAANVSKVVDTRTSPSRVLDIAITERYLANAREELATHTFPPGSIDPYIYRYLNPETPDKVLILHSE